MDSTLGIFKQSQDIINHNVAACKNRDGILAVAKACRNVQEHNESKAKVSMRKRRHALSEIDDNEFINSLSVDVFND